MDYSLIDILQVTIVSMLVVFVCLTVIMFAMILTGKVFTRLANKEAVADLSAPAMAAQQPQTIVKKNGLALVEEDALAKVAVLTALAHASQEETGKAFEVIAVERI